MPTMKQLNDNWNAERVLGISKSEFSVQGSDSPSEKCVEYNNEGEVIGTITFNPDTEELDIEIFPEDESGG